MLKMSILLRYAR